MKITIINFKTINGKYPYIEWRNELDRSIRSIILTRIDRVSIGNYGDCTPIKGGGGLAEIRIDVGPGYRIYYAEIEKDKIILLLGGIKKNQRKDIEKAKEYWIQYKGMENLK